MSTSTGRVLVVAAACLVWRDRLRDLDQAVRAFSADQRDDPDTTASIEAEPIGRPQRPRARLPSPRAHRSRIPCVNAATPKLLGRDRYDDLSLGKKYFRSANFGLAEKHFRRAVELHPRDAEAWVGLAASYDRLKRFDLADRAYGQAAGIIGETPEIMNNRGFSYILRGDYRRARRTLEAARAKAPDNPYIQNNLQLLEKIQRRGKSVNYSCRLVCRAPRR